MTSASIFEIRLEKLKKLKELGIETYPSFSVNKKPVSEILNCPLDSEVEVCGRIVGFRKHGKITFSDIFDESGKIQLAFKEDTLGEKNYILLELLDGGDFLYVKGKLFKTKAGELTVEVMEYRLLTKSLRALPSEWYGFKDVEERYRQRYVDLLLNVEVKKVFDVRHKVVRSIRNFMEAKEFVEVETPTLQPLYGGATAKPFVTHHNALDKDFYLRISDELYLKRLIVGGYEKVFEICKDFRNEGIDRQHNPEFTMMEFYWAYADYEDLMKLTEELVSSCVQVVHNGYKFIYEGVELDFKPPFERISFSKLVKDNCGIDLDKVTTEKDLLKAIKEAGIKVDLKGVIGYGALCDELYKKVARPKIKNPVFVTDYPYEILPLAKKNSDDMKRAASFQLLCMGYELVKAYNELNDPIDQKERWEEEMNLAKKGLNEYQVLDDDYIRALEYGMPPTAGWGMGIDRLISILTNQHSLKDVILFPTLKPE